MAVTAHQTKRRGDEHTDPPPRQAPALHQETTDEVGRLTGEGTPEVIPPIPERHDSSDEDGPGTQAVKVYENSNTLFCALQEDFKSRESVSFFSSYQLAEDPFVDDKKRVEMTIFKQMYQFCVVNDLREAWAYLWENWYRLGRWELWAQSYHDEIPVLKTTMILESHWRRIKHDILHHFHKPHVDLLAWVLVMKLAPTYYRKLDHLMDNKGRYCELALWRKAFKWDWKWVATTPITMPLNNKYRPNTLTWVCTCPHFSTSRFLLCKHLVQDVHAVPPLFLLEVKRNQTTLFWKHPALILLDTPTSHLNSDDTVLLTNMAAGQGDSDIRDDKESDDEGIIDVGGMENWSVGETMVTRAKLLRDFADSILYQAQFNDHRWGESLEREGACLFQLASHCLEHERQFNSTRGTSPTTWEKATTSAMYYRTHPPCADALS
ncbi:hypothetical protein SERLA73DRAFT_77294 [Serpula lacrymans var. lacrymans S7.3]|uniref:SWIM-type domain-containing protein n=1 Tax=Serpula lacrymans var. lacrymans (strain S7.3) TaxID=936435 RepID=F8Q9M5_SERL3|nr:hypothetical protein SERLA73DRAFT_77294 [Serpula lacrymans var. lacrymans S7.3]